MQVAEVARPRGRRTLADVTQLRATCDAITDAYVEFRTEQARWERVRRLIAHTDAMIAELEVLNLREADHVDARCLVRLDELVQDLPFGHGWSLEERPSPTEALDLLFDLQEGLLAMKNRARGTEVDDWEGD